MLLEDALFCPKIPGKPLFRPKIGKIAVETLCPANPSKNSAPEDFIRQIGKPVLVQIGGEAGEHI